MNNLVLRIVTALIGVAVIIGSIFLNTWVFVLVFTAIGFATHFEYMRTITLNASKKPGIELPFALAAGLAIIAAINANVFDLSAIHLLSVTVFLWPAGIIILEIFYNREKPFEHIGLNILGLLYIPLAFGLFIFYAIDFGGTVKTWFAVGLLFMVWFNDSFAYFAGRFWGKKKLFERISPKKTWEGFWGGLVMTVVCGVIMSFLFDELGLIQWMVWGVIVAVSGTLGDLAESLLKRSIQIKDSGSILPGHGGFLDRFDGFIMVIPFTVTYLEILKFFHLV
jgi:phosphatidate cytidylyltransferase